MKMEVQINFLSGFRKEFECIGVEIYDDTVIFYDKLHGIYPFNSVKTEDIENIKVKVIGE